MEISNMMNLNEKEAQTGHTSPPFAPPPTAMAAVGRGDIPHLSLVILLFPLLLPSVSPIYLSLSFYLPLLSAPSVISPLSLSQ